MHSAGGGCQPQLPSERALSCAPTPDVSPLFEKYTRLDNLLSLRTAGSCVSAAPVASPVYGRNEEGEDLVAVMDKGDNQGPLFITSPIYKLDVLSTYAASIPHVNIPFAANATWGWVVRNR